MTPLLAFIAGVFVGTLALAAALMLLSANHVQPPDPIDLSRIHVPPPSAGVRPRR